ncbi:uncharacterized protein LOC131650016 [Vicia villosa]|uniref:uncharacterized protein LOC131650016 n=1 Tax=Vicia villosa TaxID=3911 RepID=UPI00273ADD5A|nr:uncharacterized protein LOC131650016 [Vicia villosa]
MGMVRMWSGVSKPQMVDREKKRRFWSDLLNFNERFPEGEWFVGGNINAVKAEEEIRGYSRVVKFREMEEFNGFINSMKVVDVGAVGRIFSWYSLDGAGNDRNWGPKPFKFFISWTKHADIYSFAQVNCLASPRGNKSIYSFKEKLKYLRGKLRVWNVKVFGFLNLQEEEAFKNLNALDFVMVGDDPVDIEALAINRSLASKRVRNSFIGLNCVDGWMDDVGLVKEEVHSHFVRRFSKTSFWRPILEGVVFSNLSLEDSLNLEVPFSEEEVRDVLWNSDGAKSSGPDGFNMGFYKVENPSSLDDFRLIFLIGSLYRILANLLAHRLKKVIGKLVSNCQSAFVSRRNMLDGVLVVNEILDIAKRHNKECMMVKVDFEKAYDCVA